MKNIKQELERFRIDERQANRYLRFLEYCSASNFGKKLELSEKHHILPKSKCLFPEFGNLRYNEWNAIILTPRQHYIAHWILSRVFLDSRERSAALLAFSRMSANNDDVKRRFTSRQFARCREAAAESMRINNPMKRDEVVSKMKSSVRKFYETEDGDLRKQKMRETRIGVDHISDEGKRRLSDLAKQNGLGKNKTPEQIQKQREAISIGTWHTPFGIFISLNSAAKSDQNVERISGHFISKWCAEGINGYSFVPKLK
jgi:hypothetical protein